MFLFFRYLLWKMGNSFLELEQTNVVNMCLSCIKSCTVESFWLYWLYGAPLAPPTLRLCVAAYEGEEVILQAQPVHGLQAEVSDARQQTLQHGRAVLDAVEAHRAGVDLSAEQKHDPLRRLQACSAHEGGS